MISKGEIKGGKGDHMGKRRSKGEGETEKMA